MDLNVPQWDATPTFAMKCHVSVAPVYRYDATVVDQKADDFGE
jgi:hypothetical protein